MSMNSVLDGFMVRTLAVSQDEIVETEEMKLINDKWEVFRNK